MPAILAWQAFFEQADWGRFNRPHSFVVLLLGAGCYLIHFVYECILFIMQLVTYTRWTG